MLFRQSADEMKFGGQLSPRDGLLSLRGGQSLRGGLLSAFAG